MLRLLSLLLLLAACSRDLAVPPARLAPQLASSAPASAFAGARLVLTGLNLGTLATARVSVGGRPANLLAAGDGTLTVEVPSEVVRGVPVDISVATAQGNSALHKAFTYLGLGHPNTLSLRANLSLLADMRSVWVAGSRAFVLDLNHNELLALDAHDGTSQASPIYVPFSSLFAFGTATAPWVYSLGAVGSPPAVHHYDFSASRPVETCRPGATPSEGGVTLPVSATSPLPGNGSGSADGTLLAVPTGEGSVLLAHLACPPVVETVPVLAGGFVLSATVVQGNDVIAFTHGQVFRIPAGASPAAIGGTMVSDNNASIYELVRPAASPVSKTLAYARTDGNLGFVTWSGAGGAPVLDPAQIFQLFATPAAITYSDDGKSLFVASDDGVVTCWDVASAQVKGAARLGNVSALAALPGGGAMAASGGGTAVLSASGVLVHTHQVGTHLDAQGVAVDRAGFVLVPTFFGPTPVSPGAFQPSPITGSVPLPLDGVTSGEGGSVAWVANFLFLPSEDGSSYSDGGTLPDGHQIESASLSADGNFAAALSLTSTGAVVTLLPRKGGAGPAPLQLVNAVDGRVFFEQDTLYVAAIDASKSTTLQKFQPGTLTPAGLAVVLDTPAQAATGDVVQGIWASPGLGGVVVALGSLVTPNGPGNGFASSTLTLLRDDGTTLSLALPDGFADPLALSADGLMLLSASGGGLFTGVAPGVDAGLLAIDEAGDLTLTPAGHQSLAAPAGSAVSAPEGSRFYVTFPSIDSVGFLQ